MTSASSRFGRTLGITLGALLLVQAAAPGHGKDTVPIRRPLLRSIRFVDDTHGWIAGSKGVFYTSDGGKSWNRLRVNLASISQLPATSATTAITDVGRIVWADKDKAILRTDTGLAYGAIRPPRWRLVSIPPELLTRMNAIAFIDQRHGFASGTLSHQVFLTIDGGLNWESFDTPAQDILDGLFVVSPSEVWVVGLEGIVLHTTDSGRSWSRTVLTEESGDPATGLRSICFVENGEGWVCGPSGHIFHTANGGRDWQRQKTPFVANLPLSLGAVSFVNKKEGWAVGGYCANYVEQEFVGINSAHYGWRASLGLAANKCDGESGGRSGPSEWESLGSR